MSLVVETVTEIGRFAALRDDWERVNLECEAGSFFTSHDWLATWCTWFLTAGTSLYILLVWRNESLLGIAPFVIRKEQSGIKWLYLLGTGEEEASEVASEYADILVLPGAHLEVERVFADVMRKDASVWDGVQLLNVKSNSSVRPLLAGVLGRAAIRERLTGARYCVALREYPSSDAYLASLESSSFRNKLQVARRRMLKAGGDFIVVDTDSVDFDICYADLVRLHNNRWRGKGGRGVFADASFAGFHRDLLRLPGPRSSAYLAVLALDGAPVAVLYLLVYRGECHFYQSGIDPTVTPNVSPGILAHYLAIEWAIRQGFTTYDFMKGGARESYKQSFCRPGVNLYNYTMLRPRVGALLRYLAFTALNVISRIRWRSDKRCPA
ncbi:GNAT family N-acetyltransferase [Haliea sp. E1-2-M8]|uniref:GNAT family N-acetyltransferase n=1 Tax=Haliea sp. E1-2-M8 TaxID=3064706 RepID=UPI0027253D87|nr:GNAT family N-acetyltransferase [Haliea sp. E1-2-M8]MDO8860429.1 GNAT family N-acetyltransferase [Haliea sp. E1-2-M8]